MSANSLLITPYYIINKFDNGHRYITYYVTADGMFREAAYFYAMSDCCGDEMEIEEISCEGQKCYYVGWQPGMLYEFRRESDNEEVWSRYFPEWDH